MFGEFLDSCENHCFLSQTREANFWATFGKTWATYYFNIWPHWRKDTKNILLNISFEHFLSQFVVVALTRQLNTKTRRLTLPFCALCRGGCGGQVVSVLAFYSEDPSSNPADVYSFF